MPSTITLTCEHCQSTVSRKKHGGGKDSGRFCSRACNFASRKALARGWTPVRKAPELDMPCRGCGTMFSPTKRARYCSDSCRAEASRKKGRNRWARISQSMSDRRASIVGPKPPIQCADCRTQFARAYGDTRKAYCSKACAKRAQRRRHGNNPVRRAKRAGVPYRWGINPVKVFERDHWTCQICRCRTPRSARGSYAPNAPELDHIVPLSQGGGHTLDNVQCSCRSCNISKGSKALGQMRLAV